MERTRGTRLKALSLLLLIVALAQPCVAEPELHIAAEIVDQRYCAETGPLFNLKMELHFRCRNDTNEVIILPRFKRVSGYLLSRNADQPKSDAERRISSLWPDLPAYSNIWDTERPDPEYFDLLRPGQALTCQADTVYLLVTEPEPKARRSWAIEGGAYLLRTEIDFWPSDKRSAKKLAARWKSIGRLHWGRAVSEPVRFHADEDAEASPCPGPNPRLLNPR